MQDLYSVAPAFQELLDSELEELSEIDLTQEKYREFSPEMAVTNLVKMFQNNKAEIEALELEEKRLKERRDARKRRQDWIRKEIQACMFFGNTKKVKTAFYTASIRKGQPTLTVTDENKIPDEYFDVITTRKLDRRKLLDEMKVGVYVEGAEIEQKDTLSIRL